MVWLDDDLRVRHDTPPEGVEDREFVIGPFMTVNIKNTGAFVCRFKVKTNDHETDWSGHKNVNESAEFNYGELYGAGFRENMDCWVAVDVVAGKSDHNSGANFTFIHNKSVSYTCGGTVQFPSFSDAELSEGDWPRAKFGGGGGKKEFGFADALVEIGSHRSGSALFGK